MAFVPGAGGKQAEKIGETTPLVPKNPRGAPPPPNAQGPSAPQMVHGDEVRRSDAQLTALPAAPDAQPPAPWQQQAPRVPFVSISPVMLDSWEIEFIQNLRIAAGVKPATNAQASFGPQMVHADDVGRRDDQLPALPNAPGAQLPAPWQQQASKFHAVSTSPMLLDPVEIAVIQTLRKAAGVTPATTEPGPVKQKKTKQEKTRKKKAGQQDTGQAKPAKSRRVSTPEALASHPVAKQRKKSEASGEHHAGKSRHVRSGSAPVKLRKQGTPDATVVEQRKNLQDRFVAACKAGDLNRMRRLALRAQETGVKLDVNLLTPGGKNMLRLVAARGNLPAIELLVGMGADLNQVDRKGRSAFYWAAMANRAGVLGFLLESGANPELADAEGIFPICAAAAAGAIASVIELTELEIDLHLTEWNVGQNPLLTAARAGHSAIVERFLIDSLVEKEPQPKAKLNVSYSGQKVDRVALDSVKVDSYYETAYALGFRGEVGQGRRQYQSLEHEMAAADFMFRRNFGETELDLVMKEVAAEAVVHAARQGHCHVVRVFAAHGISLDAWDDDETALTAAIDNGRAEMVEILLRHGADANKVDRRRISPLAHAIQANSVEMVRCLLRHGAEAAIAGIAGSSALEYARSLPGRSPVIIDLLRAAESRALASSSGGSSSIRGEDASTLVSLQ
ncbi:MAG: hypothetical protein JWP36_1265 [Paucimonas sp.]|nr:hypothetical protein [Paucimonas sp.]